MKTQKRILAYLLTLTLAMTSLPTQLFAQIINDNLLPYSQNVKNINEYTFNGHTYSIIKEPMLWPDAKVYCENLGGHLVTISSKEENTFIQGILVENRLNSYTAIGYSDAEKEGEWKWVTGEDSVYTNWDLSWPEPNNGVWLGVQNYAFMISNGTWDDGFLNTKAIFICEWDKESKPVLTFEVDGATKLEIVKNTQNIDQYSPNPFTITVNVKNIGLETVTNANITLNLPKGMEVVDSEQSISLGNIPVGTKQHQVSWKINVAPSAVDKVEEYSMTLVADNAEDIILKREINIPGMQLNLSRRIGYMYEQTVDIDENTLIPKINSVKTTLIDLATNTYSLTIGDFECDSNGKAFFYWKADEALFTSASEDFKQVECIIDKGISGRNIPIIVYIGDCLGHVTSYKIWIKAN